MQRASVVLPLPDSPTSARHSWARSVMSTSWRISLLAVPGGDAADGHEPLLAAALELRARLLPARAGACARTSS